MLLFVVKFQIILMMTRVEKEKKIEKKKTKQKTRIGSKE